MQETPWPPRAWGKLTPDTTFLHYLFSYGVKSLDNGTPIKYPSQYLENIYAFRQVAGQTAPKTGEEYQPPLGQLHAQSCPSIFEGIESPQAPGQI